MATKKAIMRRLLRGGVSWSEAARSLGCSKVTFVKCAAKMREEAIGAAGSGSMADVGVSGLFSDGRSKRGEERLESDRTRLRPAHEASEDDAYVTVDALLRMRPGREEALPVPTVLQEGRRPCPGAPVRRHLPWFGWICAERLSDISHACGYPPMCAPCKPPGHT